MSSLASLHLHLSVLVVLFYKTSQSGPGLGLRIVSYLCKDPFQIRSQSQQWGESIHQHFRRHSSTHKSVKVTVLCFNLLDKYRTIKAFCAKKEATVGSSCAVTRCLQSRSEDCLLLWSRRAASNWVLPARCTVPRPLCLLDFQEIYDRIRTDFLSMKT